MIGCTCKVCKSMNTRNQRLRPSGLVTLADKKLLIDSGPDFRTQALKVGLNQLDGLLLTHSHYDHLGGLDELRIYYVWTRKPLAVLVSEPTFLDIKHRYDYFFKERSINRSLTAQLDFQVLKEKRGVTQFLGFDVGYMQYEQGGMPVMGYRVGSFAYISDIRNYPETIFSDLTGVKTLVVSALKKEPSPMHFSLDEGVDFARKIGAQQTFFMHLGHELDYDETNALLPSDIQLAYDGLKVDFDYEPIPISEKFDF